ncbi:MAG: thioredoxin [Deltaproteobacteria bacterium]|nr:MAG: thioredoxin [Deltaproteobacteria bacterium]
MAGANVHTFTDANFEAEVLSSDLPVLVDFWAVWCGPCRAIAPIIDELSSEYKGKMKVGKVDTDKNQKVAMQLGISSIPAVFLFKNGQVVERIIGARPKSAFVKQLARHIG